MAVRFVAYLAFLALASYAAYATDPNQLQDFCVAVDNPTAGLFVNGLFCKNPNDVIADDFAFKAGFDVAGPLNKLGSSVNLVNAGKFKALNTLGISIARIDFAPYGENPPHTHPRATEILTVLEGTLYVGFVTSNLNPGNKLFAKTLYPGDVFVFPQGLIHFQFNVGAKPAVAIAALSSQNPGTVTIANAVFGSNPPISDDVLTKAFQLNKDTVNYLQSTFGA